MTTKRIVQQESKVIWTGKKIGGQHSGSIKLKDGYLEFEGDELKGGEISIDMSSINSEDLQGSSKKKLEDHLHSDDFFSTAKHPTSTMKITEVSKSGDLYKIKGDLEIKALKKPIEFDLSLQENSAKGEFNVDRTEFDIRYASKKFFGAIGDKALHDHFNLNVDLKF